MLKKLLRRKSMDQLVADGEEPEHRLKKTLGPVDVTAIGIGGIIGAGIFATIGTAARGPLNGGDKNNACSGFVRCTPGDDELQIDAALRQGTEFG